MKNKQRRVQAAKYASRQPVKRRRRDSLENSDVEPILSPVSDSESDEDFFQDKKQLRFDDNVEEVLPITNEDSSEDEEASDEEGAIDDEEASYVDEEHNDVDMDNENGVLEGVSSGSEDEQAGNLNAWGKKKSTFRGTNFTDKDWGRSYRSDDDEIAEAEKIDILANQSSLMNEFNLDLPERDVQIKDSTKDGDTNITSSHLKDIDRNDQLKTFQKQSPEFRPIVQFFREKLLDLKTRMLPLTRHLKRVGGTDEPYSSYIFYRTELLLAYCMNASFYMTLKCVNKGSVTRHPVIKMLSEFKVLLDQLQNLDMKLNPLLDEMLKNSEQSDAAALKLSNIFSNKETNPPMPSKKGMSSNLIVQNGNDASKTKVKKQVSFYTDTEKEVLAGYMAKKEQKQKTTEEEEEQSEDEEDVHEMDYEENGDAVQPKRSISYQIAKNKGLLPHRKKEYRNPRVRHRMKFKKAEIRRKGQVRLPRKELKKYGGEMSGISSHVIKSIKIK